ncbi:hypothetical protein COB52_02955 [Candidatus Kaiserbacteria bacterium]|nr:MAG: hypothetical protein COB52_02955 [Candidatus Kaiserbacteria bacterium]
MDERDAKIAKLEELLKNQEVSAKMLIRRDLELNRAYAKLEELGQLKSDFVSVVAHQLRTPLSVTKWSLDMLWEISKKTLTPDEVRVLLRGKESNERMIRLVDNLLNVDLHEVGKVQYSFNSMSLIEQTESVVEQLMPVATKRNITLTLTSEEGIPNINGDDEKLSSVIQNLIENALKYTPKGGSVSVEVIKKEEKVVVSVKDTGIGIPKAEKDQLFKKFYRGENAIKTITEGSGLGLFIAQKIIRRHGGKIWFESEVGNGATFYFTIPLESIK